MEGVGMDELRVAAKRLAEGEFSENYPKFMATTFGLADGFLLARAYLADHPEDDCEPVTHQWLRCVGFTRGMQTASTCVLSLWSERNHISIEIDDDGYVRVAIGDSDVSEYLPAGFSMQTRGDVRRLCKALGISLVG
jgi:hypothetical protein